MTYILDYFSCFLLDFSLPINLPLRIVPKRKRYFPARGYLLYDKKHLILVSNYGRLTSCDTGRYLLDRLTSIGKYLFQRKFVNYLSTSVKFPFTKVNKR